MWRLKQFIPKEPAGLEGRTIDVGSVKIVVRNAIAEGGFSCVYLARDAANQSKQYALKHMICQDRESLDLVMQEISVMKLLRGHPNVVTLVAHSIFDMGRTREALLVMEFCDKSLVTVLESRGAGYFEEKQILLIFRDVCNAVFAMHCQSPPIAHRDLKAENILLGSDGAWKLCDFGSTSTNHKCFDRPEEMGVEEDNIRKHTTPAYRAPEMWDLYRREVISEKVDIWALGCLLYRICYFKSAFDGESKLQILNGNYRIPELPKYSASIMSLIKDMLESSPDARPDITQVWFRVNELLPAELQKHLPDGSLSGSAVDMHPPTLDVNHEEIPKRSPVMPRRSPPPPPPSRDQVRSNSPQSEKEVQHARPSLGTSKVSGGGSPMGAFWSTQHAQNSYVVEGKGPLFDKEQTVRRSVRENSFKAFEDSRNEDFEISFSPEQKLSHPESKPTFQNEAFNTFVVDFNSSTINKINKSAKEKELEEEVEKLREQLKQANSEKAEITSKYDKLSAICRSQRQEIQELKQALPASTPSPPSRDINSKTRNTPPREKIEGTVWELEQGMFASSEESQDRKPWQAFAEPKAQTTPKSTNHPRSVRTTNGHRGTSKQQVVTPNKDEWGFGQDSFSAASPGGGSSGITRASAQGSTSLRFSGGETKKVETSQPAGWAGF